MVYCDARLQNAVSFHAPCGTGEKIFISSIPYEKSRNLLDIDFVTPQNNLTQIRYNNQHPLRNNSSSPTFTPLLHKICTKMVPHANYTFKDIKYMNL